MHFRVFFLNSFYTLFHCIVLLKFPFLFAGNSRHLTSRELQLNENEENKTEHRGNRNTSNVVIQANQMHKKTITNDECEERVEFSKN